MCIPVLQYFYACFWCNRASRERIYYIAILDLNLYARWRIRVIAGSSKYKGKIEGKNECYNNGLHYLHHLAASSPTPAAQHHKSRLQASRILTIARRRLESRSPNSISRHPEFTQSLVSSVNGEFPSRSSSKHTFHPSLLDPVSRICMTESKVESLHSYLTAKAAVNRELLAGNCCARQ